MTSNSFIKIRTVINKDAFSSIASEESAYFLGLLTADGNIRKMQRGQHRITLKLQEKDRNIVESFSKWIFNMDFSRIYDSPANRPRGQSTVEVTIHSDSIASNLQALGCVPNKSYNLIMPSSLKTLLLNEKELAGHWFRGLMDGDGSLTYSKPGMGSIELYCISESFLCDVMSVVHGHTGTNMNFHRKHGTIHGIRVGGTQKIAPILRWMYDGAHISIPRKQLRANELLALATP